MRPAVSLLATAPTLEDVAALMDEHLAPPPYPATATDPLASNLTQPVSMVDVRVRLVFRPRSRRADAGLGQDE